MVLQTMAGVLQRTVLPGSVGLFPQSGQIHQDRRTVTPVEEGVEETKETDPSECAMCVTEPSDVHNNKKLKRSLSDT